MHVFRPWGNLLNNNRWQVASSRWSGNKQQIALHSHFVSVCFQCHNSTVSQWSAILTPPEGTASVCSLTCFNLRVNSPASPSPASNTVHSSRGTRDAQFQSSGSWDCEQVIILHYGSAFIWQNCCIMNGDGEQYQISCTGTICICIKYILVCVSHCILIALGDVRVLVESVLRTGIMSLSVLCHCVMFHLADLSKF